MTEQIKWHDLRKNPDDVPMINHKVLIGCYNDDFHVARFLINSQGQKHWNTSDNRWIRHEDVCWWKEFDKPSCRRAEILYKHEERENDKRRSD